LILLFALNATRSAGQADKVDPSADYLMTLQRAMSGNPVNTTERRTQFCAEFQQIMAGMKTSQLGGELGSADQFNCDKILADTGSTPYEAVDFVWLRRRIEPEIRSALSSLGKKLPNEPVIGTLPMPTLNAKAFVPPGGGRPVIALNNEVFRLPYEAVRASLQALSFDDTANGLTMTYADPKEIAARLVGHPETVHGMEWAMLRYLHLVSGTPNDGYLTVDSKLGVVKNILFLEGLTDAIETFIMSHEYAHVVLGHTLGTTSAFGLAAAPGKAVSVRQATYSWRQEFEADAYGFIILDEVLKQQATRRSGSYLKDPLYPLYLHGPRFFFKTMIHVEDAKAYTETGAPAPGPSKIDVRIAKLAVSSMFTAPTRTKGGDAGSGSTVDHPPFLFREKQAELIEQHALSLFLDKADLEPGTKGVYLLSGAFDAAFDVLFEAAVPELRKRYEDQNGGANGTK
jgi:hypothetical protein